MQSNQRSQSDKVLLTFYRLNKDEDGRKLALEDIAVNAWKDNPTEFCLRGYKDHPDVKRIERIISNLKSLGFIRGNAYNYRLTPDGIKYVQGLSNIQNKGNIKIKDTAETSRTMRAEILRIIRSRIFREYTEAKNSSKTVVFLESDFFEFLGTSARSLGTPKERKQFFLPKYNLIVNEVIPFCKKNAKTDRDAAVVIELWNILFEKFGKIIEGKAE